LLLKYSKNTVINAFVHYLHEFDKKILTSVECIKGPEYFLFSISM